MYILNALGNAVMNLLEGKKKKLPEPQPCIFLSLTRKIKDNKWFSP